MEGVKTGLFRIFGWNVFSKIFGNVRTALYLVWFGLTLSMDHFYVAYGLMVGVMSAIAQIVELVSLPHLSKAREEGKGFASGTLTCLSITLAASLLVLIFFWFCRDIVLSVVAAGSTISNRNAVGEELLYLAVFGVLFALSSVCGGIISTAGSYSHFHFVHFLTIVGSLCYLTFKHEDPTEISISLAIGSLIGLALQIRFLCRRSLIRWKWDPGLPPLLLRSAGPLFCYVGGMQAIAVTDRSFATALEPGSVSVFYYTSIVVTLPVIIFGLQQVLLPIILNRQENRDWIPFTRLILFSVCQVSMFLFFYGGDLAVSVLEAVSVEGVKAEQWIAGFRGLSFFLIPYVGWMFASRLCQAHSRHWVLGVIGIGGGLLNFFLNHVGVTLLGWGLTGLGLASVLTMTTMAGSSFFVSGAKFFLQWRTIFSEGRAWWTFALFINTGGILSLMDFFPILPAGAAFVLINGGVILLYVIRNWDALFTMSASRIE